MKPRSNSDFVEERQFCWDQPLFRFPSVVWMRKAKQEQEGAQRHSQGTYMPRFIRLAVQSL